MKQATMFISFFFFFFFSFCSIASSWPENAAPELKGDRTYDGDANNCTFCHKEKEHTLGPHGGYTTTTNKCQVCHTVHKANSSLLLPVSGTVTDVCKYCHDLTQSKFAPYDFTDENSVTDSVYSAHRVSGIRLPNDYINASGELVKAGQDYDLSGEIIPGGSDNNGGLGYFDGSKQGKRTGNSLGCFSCHAVHAIQSTMVNPYLSDSQEKVTTAGYYAGHEEKIYMTNRLLRNHPNLVSDTVYDYGTKWCLACHRGRSSSLPTIHNHPVNQNASGFDYLNILPDNVFVYPGGKDAALEDIREKGYILVDDGQNNGTLEGAHINKDPRSNAQFAMVSQDPIKGSTRPDGYIQYDTNGPICQQCHGNPRDVEEAFSMETPNPKRMSFPHVSPNKSLLVEVNDDLCTNCHNIVNLP